MSPDPSRQERLDRISEMAARTLIVLLAIEIVTGIALPPLFLVLALPSPSSVDIGTVATTGGILLAVLGRGSVIRLVGRK